MANPVRWDFHEPSYIQVPAYNKKEFKHNFKKLLKEEKEEKNVKDIKRFDKIITD